MPISFLLAALFVLPVVQDTDKSKERQPRKFELTYGAELIDLPADANVRVWFPIAESDELQNVTRSQTQTPTKLSTAREKKHNNMIGYFEVSQSADVQFNITYQIQRKEARPGESTKPLAEAEAKKYLQADQMVPITGEPTQLLSDKELSADPLQLGQELYEIVETYMSYDKSKPGYGNGDVLWACSSKTGNCTDFHSLFISLARNRKLPARFEIGFPIGAEQSGKIGGYHCWAWFYTKQQGWIAVDISEADKSPELKEYYFGHLTPDRVAFSTGRDIQLVPKSKTESLNYFVYPHVEVDGKLWPKEKIKLKLSYKDLK